MISWRPFSLGLAALLGACAGVTLLPSRSFEEMTCETRGTRGRAEIRCELDDSVSLRRLRVVAVEPGKIRLVGEASEGIHRGRRMGIDTPLSVGGLQPGEYAIVVLGSEGDEVRVGRVEVRSLSHGEQMDQAGWEVYGTR